MTRKAHFRDIAEESGLSVPVIKAILNEGLVSVGGKAYVTEERIRQWLSTGATTDSPHPAIVLSLKLLAKRAKPK